MKKRRFKRLCCLTVYIISGCLLISFQAESALLCKTYLVRQVGGIEILCNPYVVQKHDWILKVFRQKGEIAHSDFPEFLRIFKRINPQINNLDIIRPGQHILIPLKKLLPSSLPGQGSGIITIPFVTLASATELLGKHMTRYEVQKGDCVSKLVAKRFGIYGAQSYKEGIELFKKVNPGITNLDHIKAGQKIYIPESSVQNESWYASMFDNRGKLISDFEKKAMPPAVDLSAFESEAKKNQSKTPLATIASILEAKLFDKGFYHFPGKGKMNIELNLARFPVLEFNNGERVICAEKNSFSESKKEVIQSYWNDMKFAEIPAEASFEQVFDATLKAVKRDNLKNRLSFYDNGVQVIIQAKWIIDKTCQTTQGVNHVCLFMIDNLDQKIPYSILRYLSQHNIIIQELFLGDNKIQQQSPEAQASEYDEKNLTISFKDHKSFVQNLLAAIGYTYNPDVSISFPYAGVQVKTVSNFILLDSGQSLLVDYGEFYGDSVEAIKKSGFNIVQIFKEDSFKLVTEKILDVLEISYQKNLRLYAAQRPGPHNVDLIIAGFLINTKDNKKVFLPDFVLDNELVQFFKDRQIKLIIAENEKERASL